MEWILNNFRKFLLICSFIIIPSAVGIYRFIIDDVNAKQNEKISDLEVRFKDIKQQTDINNGILISVKEDTYMIKKILMERSK